MQLPGYRGMKALVAEDDEICRLVMENLLRKLEMNTIMASNGLEVLRVLSKTKVDIIIMDIKMPYLDGIEAAKKIREIEKCKKCYTPIVAYTASVSNIDRKNCLDAGFDDFIPKPIDIEQFLRTLERILAPISGI